MTSLSTQNMTDALSVFKEAVIGFLMDGLVDSLELLQVQGCMVLANGLQNASHFQS